MPREFIPVGETITDGTDDDLLAVKDGKITYKTLFNYRKIFWFQRTNIV
jgi:ribosomal protein L27